MTSSSVTELDVIFFRKVDNIKVKLLNKTQEYANLMELRLTPEQTRLANRLNLPEICDVMGSGDDFISRISQKMFFWLICSREDLLYLQETIQDAFVDEKLVKRIYQLVPKNRLTVEKALKDKHSVSLAAKIKVIKNLVKEIYLIKSWEYFGSDFETRSYGASFLNFFSQFNNLLSEDNYFYCRRILQHLYHLAVTEKVVDNQATVEKLWVIVSPLLAEGSTSKNLTVTTMIDQLFRDLVVFFKELEVQIGWLVGVINLKKALGKGVKICYPQYGQEFEMIAGQDLVACLKQGSKKVVWLEDQQGKDIFDVYLKLGISATKNTQSTVLLFQLMAQSGLFVLAKKFTTQPQLNIWQAKLE